MTSVMMQRAYARLHQHDVRAKQTKVCDAERAGSRTPMRALRTHPGGFACQRPKCRLVTKVLSLSYHIYSLYSALRLRLSASARFGNEPATVSYQSWPRFSPPIDNLYEIACKKEDVRAVKWCVKLYVCIRKE